MLYFFTLNTAPLGVIEKHVKLLNLWFVYERENECCNKWASVFVIVSNYTRRNNSVKVEPVCGPFTLTRQRPQDIHAPYNGRPKYKTGKKKKSKTLLYFQMFLFVSSGTYQKKNDNTFRYRSALSHFLNICIEFYCIRHPNMPAFIWLNCFLGYLNKCEWICVFACVWMFYTGCKIVMPWGEKKGQSLLKMHAFCQILTLETMWLPTLLLTT